jgi:hypothetical protein
MSYENSEGKVSLCLTPCKLAPDIAVVLSFKVPEVDWFALRKLKRNKMTKDEQYSEGTQVSCLCYALFQRVTENMSGSVKELLKFVSTDFDCDAQDGHFIISFKVRAVKSNMVRAMAKAAASLEPGRCKSEYRAACVNLGLKYDEKDFNACVGHLNKAIKSSLSFYAVGKFALEKYDKNGSVVTTKTVKDSDGKTKTEKVMTAKEYVNEVSGLLTDKLPPLNDGGSGSVPHKKNNFNEADTYCEVDGGAGMKAFLAADYICNKTNYGVNVVNNKVVVWAKSFTGAKNSISKDKTLDNWAGQRYGAKRLEDCLTAFTTYHIINHSPDKPPASELCKFAKSGATAKTISADIRKYLNASE